MALDDSYSKILLHFDGPDESTTFTDESGKTWTANGTAQLDTALKKFGSASLLVNDGHATTPDHADFTVGSGDFTVDFWVRFTGDTNAGWLFALPTNAGTYTACGLKTSGTNPNIHLDLYCSAGGSWDIISAGTANLTTGVWYHIAVIRNGTNIRVYIDGTYNINATSSATLADGINTFGIGAKDATGVIINTKIDEFRFSLGIARWTANFTPPTSAYGPGGIYADFEDGVGFSDTVEAMVLSETISEGIGLADTVEAFSLSETITEGVGLADTIDAFSLSETITEGIGLADTIESDVYNLKNLIFPLLTCSAEGTVRSGSLYATLPILTIIATGQIGAAGSSDASLPVLQISASGLSGIVGSLAKSLPAITLVASAYILPVGQADLTLPMLYINAHGKVIVTPDLVIIMNLRNMAVSEYDWSGFNSFALFNSQYLAAKSTGIYILGGDTDNGLPIQSEIELGQIPVGLEKPRDIYVLGRASGTMAVELSADENTEKEVNFSDMLETLNQGRVKIPRGIDPSAYYSLTLKNKNGSDFDIDEIQIYGESSSRKKR